MGYWQHLIDHATYLQLLSPVSSCPCRKHYWREGNSLPINSKASVKKNSLRTAMIGSIDGSRARTHSWEEEELSGSFKAI